ncbi:MAG: P-II family nitrogen regulator [Deltaproteobacteria bacterium]|jgi:nitrogen regulatory protein P-II 1|nr:P-II family nitrogen regulator [Deltaproteobacteria bacterium]
MKLVTAFVRPEILQDVKTKLYAHDLFSMSITNVLGAGQQKGYTEAYRGVQTEVNLLKKLRLEIALPDEKVEVALQAISEAAKTGQAGDGVIFVQNIERSLRIRTGEPV